MCKGDAISFAVLAVANFVVTYNSKQMAFRRTALENEVLIWVLQKAR